MLKMETLKTKKFLLAVYLLRQVLAKLEISVKTEICQKFPSNSVQINSKARHVLSSAMPLSLKPISNLKFKISNLQGHVLYSTDAFRI